MRYHNKPELQERLAAEYVLGTLRGPARLRFQAWLREDARLRTVVSVWESRLAPMAAGVAEVRPPRRLWSVIEQRLRASDAAATTSGFWESLAFWRGWGMVATGCVAALAVTMALRPPQRVEVPIVQRIEVPAVAMQPAYVAMLYAQHDSQKLVFVAYANRNSDELWVKQMAMDPMPPEHGYELWGLPAQPGMPPKSLGMVPKEEKGTMKLAQLADQSLKDFAALAISVEPASGSKTGQPTGPVVASGDCLKFW
jgi:anti-sigma-K factor RskA